MTGEANAGSGFKELHQSRCLSNMKGGRADRPLRPV